MTDFWSPIQNLIEEACSNFDKTWQKRKRIINTHFLVIFILKLVLSKNNQGYKILLNELWESADISKLQQNSISASSLCEARQKMPSEIFTKINEQILAIREKSDPLPLWRNHRVFSVDGSKINVPRELLALGYKAPNKHQYYPQGQLSTLYHLGTGLVYDAILSANRDERACLLKHMDRLSPGDVLVLDRGYFSYLILSKALEKGLHLICRLQSGNVNKEIQMFLASDKSEEIITYTPSVATKSESKKRGYEIELKPIKFRLIKYSIADEIYVCGTTLMGENYPASEFPGVYHGRWGIEELYKISKVFIDIEDFHSKSELGVKQECYAHILLINLARIFEFERNKQLHPISSNKNKQSDDSDNSRSNSKNSKQGDSYWQDFCGEIQRFKINFKNCLLVVGRSLEKLLSSAKNIKIDWLKSLLTGITKVRQKIRPGRHEPRQSRKPINKWKSCRGDKVAYA